MKRQHIGMLLSILMIAQPLMAAHLSVIDWQGAQQQNAVWNSKVLLPSEKGRSNITELSKLVINGKLNDIKLLIAQQQTPEAKKKLVNGYGKDPYKVTPLHYAAAKGNVQIIQALLTAGANPDAQDTAGRTPLMWAIAKAGDASFDALIDKTNLMVRDHTSRIALHWAVSKAKFPMAQKLIAKGGIDAIRAKDGAGNTPLHYAMSIHYSFSPDKQTDPGASMNGSFAKAVAIAGGGAPITTQASKILAKATKLGIAAPVGAVSTFAQGGSSVTLVTANASGKALMAVMPGDTDDSTQISALDGKWYPTQGDSAKVILGTQAKGTVAELTAQMNRLQAVSSLTQQIQKMTLAEMVQAKEKIDAMMGIPSDASKKVTTSVKSVKSTTTSNTKAKSQSKKSSKKNSTATKIDAYGATLDTQMDTAGVPSQRADLIAQLQSKTAEVNKLLNTSADTQRDAYAIRNALAKAQADVARINKQLADFSPSEGPASSASGTIAEGSASGTVAEQSTTAAGANSSEFVEMSTELRTSQVMSEFEAEMAKVMEQVKADQAARAAAGEVEVTLEGTTFDFLAPVEQTLDDAIVTANEVFANTFEHGEIVAEFAETLSTEFPESAIEIQAAIANAHREIAALEGLGESATDAQTYALGQWYEYVSMLRDELTLVTEGAEEVIQSGYTTIEGAITGTQRALQALQSQEVDLSGIPELFSGEGLGQTAEQFAQAFDEWLANPTPSTAASAGAVAEEGAVAGEAVESGIASRGAVALQTGRAATIVEPVGEVVPEAIPWNAFPEAGAGVADADAAIGVAAGVVDDAAAAGVGAVRGVMSGGTAVAETGTTTTTSLAGRATTATITFLSENVSAEAGAAASRAAAAVTTAIADINTQLAINISTKGIQFGANAAAESVGLTIPGVQIVMLFALAVQLAIQFGVEAQEKQEKVDRRHEIHNQRDKIIQELLSKDSKTVTAKNNPYISDQPAYLTQNKDGRIPSHFAAIAGNPEPVKLVNSKDDSVLGMVDNAGFTPLMYAIMRGRGDNLDNCGLSKKSLKQGFAKNGQGTKTAAGTFANPMNLSPLKTSLMFETGKIFDAVFKEIKDTDIYTDIEGKSILHYAALGGKRLKKVYDTYHDKVWYTCIPNSKSAEAGAYRNIDGKKESMLTARDIYGATPIHYVAATSAQGLGYALKKLQQELKEQKKDKYSAVDMYTTLTAMKDKNGMTPLHYAALSGRMSCVQNIMMYSGIGVKTSEDMNKAVQALMNVKVSAQDTYGNAVAKNLVGKTAKDLAVAAGYPGVVVALSKQMGLSKDEIKKLKDKAQKAKKERRQANKYDKKRAPAAAQRMEKWEEKDIKRKTETDPMIKAAKEGRPNVVESLSKQGHDVTAVEADTGRTALMYAADKGHKEMIKMILSAADKQGVKSKLLAIKDKKNKTARDYAGKQGGVLDLLK